MKTATWLAETQHTVKHNTLMLYNNVLHVSVHQNRHRAPLLQQFQQHNHTDNMHIVVWH